MASKSHCDGFANELIKLMVTASGLAETTFCSRSVRACSSKGDTSVPSVAIRPGASTVSSSGASGSGFFHVIQLASPMKGKSDWLSSSTGTEPKIHYNLPPGTCERRVWRMSLNPSVTTKATLAPFCSRIALVAIVVP